MSLGSVFNHIKLVWFSNKSTYIICVKEAFYRTGSLNIIYKYLILQVIFAKEG